MSEEEADRRRAIVQLATAILSLAVMMWHLTPEHHRKLLEMRLAAASRRLCERAALRCGHQSMTVELTTGQARYEIPWLLSMARDKAAAWYERARSA